MYLSSQNLPLMVLFNFLKFYHDNVYINLGRSNNTKQIVNYTPLHERDSYIHVSNLTSNQFYFACMIYFDLICTFILLMLSGDIESNPGPSSQSTSISSASSISDPLLDEFDECITQFTSFMHLNVQSLVPNIDLLNVEFQKFDILCFTETWLNTNVANQDISLDNFKSPFRKDRVDRLRGDVAIYVKNDYHVVHRNDLEVIGVEYVWVEIKISRNHPVLIGTFNRPPDSLNYTFDLIEHSIDLAVDTGVNAIVVLCDFNEDQLKPQNNKMFNIFVRYNMIQFINEPTHFTENSSSCIYLISSTDPNVIDLINAGQPFLSVNVRNHCPIYGIFKVPKTLHTCFKRRIRLYDRGNYNQFREKWQRVDCDELINSGNSLDDVCESFSNVIITSSRRINS